MRRIIFSTVRRGGFSLVVVLGMLAAPGCAAACSYCGLSIVNLLFPFMWTGIWVLGFWRILDLLIGWKRVVARSITSISLEIGLVLLLLVSARQGGLFLYLLGAFVHALIRSLRHARRDRPQTSFRVRLALNVTALLVLLPVAARAYVAMAGQDNLDRLRLYVYPGTGQSRFLAMEIAREKTLDLNRLREMLLSPVDADSTKATEVLRQRRKSEDLLALQDIILNIPETEYSIETGSSSRWGIWLPLWLEAVVGHEVETRAELEEWIQNQKTKSAGEPIPSPGAVIESATGTP